MKHQDLRSDNIIIDNKMNVKIIKGEKYIVVNRTKKIIGTNVETKPFPGFPTDLQAQMMVLMTKAE